MELKDWLDKQGAPHGFECIGIDRMQQVWDAAKDDEREACAMECTTLKVLDTTSYTQEGYAAVLRCAEAIRNRSN